MTTAPDCTAIGAYSNDMAAPGAEKCQVDVLKRIYAQSLHSQLLAVEFERLARGSRGGEELDRGGRKLPSLHHVKHFNSYSASCANDCNSILSGHRESI